MVYVDWVIIGFLIRVERVDDFCKFLILIMSCKNVLKDIGYFRCINNFDVFKKIVDWFLFDMKCKWCDIVDDILECKYWEIIIEDVVFFIEKRVRFVLYLVFGDIFN